MQRLVFASLLLAVAVASAACFEESGNEYKGVAEGKLAPPGAVLVQEWPQQESFDPASYNREYRSTMSQGEVSRWYAAELVGRGWAGDSNPQDHHDRIVWRNDNLEITVSHDQKKIEGSHWSVEVRPVR